MKRFALLMLAFVAATLAFTPVDGTDAFSEAIRLHRAWDAAVDGLAIVCAACAVCLAMER